MKYVLFNWPVALQIITETIDFDFVYKIVFVSKNLILFTFYFRGFCYFNSLAIATKLLRKRLQVPKVLIVDWVRLLLLLLYKS